jgi:hypothetical protein
LPGAFPSLILIVDYRKRENYGLEREKVKWMVKILK